MIMTVGQEMRIGELAEEARVSVRTVRFYISLGLLESPERRGRAATYTTEQLDRLRLIRTLVDRRVPLQEIQGTLARVQPADVRKLLAQQTRQSTETAEARARSPRDYVSALLERAVTPAAPTRAPPQMSAPLATSGSVRERSPMPPEGTWRRVVLAPGVELHLDVSREADNQALVERLMEVWEHETRRPHGNKQSE